MKKAHPPRRRRMVGRRKPGRHQGSAGAVPSLLQKPKKKARRALKKPTYRLAVDIFSVDVSLANNFVCGGVDDEFETKFEIEVRGLDKSGFASEVKTLIEGVHSAFNPKDGMLKASCEELAEGVAYAVQRTLRLESGQELVSIKTRVMNRTGHVDFSWHEDEQAPRFPRLATAEERSATKDPERAQPRC